MKRVFLLVVSASGYASFLSPLDCGSICRWIATFDLLDLDHFLGDPCWTLSFLS